MSSILGALLSFVLLYKYIGLAVIIFFAATLLPLPSNTVLLATGAFASQGYFNFAVALIVSVGTNVIADCSEYTLARLYGPSVLKYFKLKISGPVARVEGYIRTHPGITIFITRFVGVLGVAGNLLGGLAPIPFWKFLTADFAGNFIEIGGVLILGYVFGEYWQNIVNFLSVGGWILFVIIILFAASIIFHHNRKKR